MPKKTYASVDDYIASQAPAVQHVLRRVRNAIRQAVPRADETISYGMPTYKLDGRAVIYFAGWSEHYSVYPWTAGLTEALGSELTPYEAGKGTLRFALADPVPVRLIARIAKLRAQEVAERGAKKSRVTRATPPSPRGASHSPPAAMQRFGTCARRVTAQLPVRSSDRACAIGDCGLLEETLWVRLQADPRPSIAGSPRLRPRTRP